MNYELHYSLLIQKAKSRITVPNITEKHHILPRSMGGNNSKENLVHLTPKEHFVAHHLLWKMHRTKQMHFAFWLMVNKTSRDGVREYRVNSRTYQSAKEQHSIEVSRVHTGKVRSEETRKKSSIALKGKPTWSKGRTGIHSKEALAHLSKIQKGRKDSEETKLKKSKSAKLRPMANDIHSAESIDKRVKSHNIYVENSQITCPHCKVTGVDYNMRRYHFDNCKTVNLDREIISKSKGITLTKHKCPYCDMETSMGNLKRWHFDNCKNKGK